MIDLHSHIIPKIDDGPANLKQSLEMVRKYAEAGYHQVVATPHYILGSPWMHSPEFIKKKVNELNQAITKEGVDLTILPGMEVAMDARMGELLDTGKLLTLAEKSYVLIETPFQRIPPQWKELFFDLISRDYKILLAHPERCGQLSRTPKLCDEIIAFGVYFQINWLSFLGFYGREVERLTRYMAKNGFIHCLATDSHDSDYRHAGQVKHAMKLVEKLIGKENAELLSKKNPSRVLEDKPLISMKKSSKLRKFGRK